LGQKNTPLYINRKKNGNSLFSAELNVELLMLNLPIEESNSREEETSGIFIDGIR
jgi:hypothetical protein